MLLGAEIYYFSGTGNSLAIARDMAIQLNAQQIPIASVMGKVLVQTDADVIGIVFPVHNVVNGGLPIIVRRFVTALQTNPSAYIFAVCTCGAGSGEALPNIAKIIKANGGKLAAGFTVKMPFNCPPFTDSAERAKRFRDWHQTLAEIGKTVESRDENEIKAMNIFIRIAVYPLGLLMKFLILRNYRKLAQVPKFSFDEAVYHVDQSYVCDDACDGCGICAKVCPVNNIEMVDDRPVWQHHCESCLACLVWCPHKLISGGILSGQEVRYHHPQMKLAEMLQQSNK